MLSPLLSAFGQAGGRRITGTVVNAASEPVAGATVAVKGTSAATSTTSTGTFAINAKTGDVLVVSSVGLEPRN